MHEWPLATDLLHHALEVVRVGKLTSDHLTEEHPIAVDIDL